MSNIVILKAYVPEKNPEVVCRPVQDRTGLTYTGQGKEGYFEALSEDQKRKMGYVITPGTAIKVSNGHTLNLDNLRDRENWKWLSKHPYITLKEMENKPNEAAFFVYDAKTDAANRVSRDKRRTMVRAQIYQLAETDQRELAGALGLGDTSGLSIDEVIDYLIAKVDVSPGVVEPLLKDKGAVTVQKLLNDALNRGVVAKSRGWYKFEDVNLGNGEESAIAYLRDPQNEEVVLAIRASIEQTE